MVANLINMFMATVEYVEDEVHKALKEPTAQTVMLVIPEKEAIKDHKVTKDPMDILDPVEIKDQKE